MTMIDAAVSGPLNHALNGNRKNGRQVLELMEEFGVEDVSIFYRQKIDIIYYDYERKLVVNERCVPRNFARLYAECERRNPKVAKIWLDMIVSALTRPGGVHGKS
jgi:hypothetical protein